MKTRYFGFLWVRVILLGCVVSAGLGGDEQPKSFLVVDSQNCATEAYMSLLKRFPEEAQGKGWDPGESEPAAQPMTYGLVLSAEVLHFRTCPNDESRRRIREATNWLLNNSDLDRDGFVGWGLPQAWDAFNDGSINGPNQPYTITTAIVMQGLLDSLSIDSFWSTSEQSELRALLTKVSLRWSESAWTQEGTYGYFWYSPSPNDAKPVINVSAMFLGVLQRFLEEEGNSLAYAERQLIDDRVEKAARHVLATIEWHHNAPFWPYQPGKKTPEETERPNDLVHHTYILWGMELYRLNGGRVVLPFTRSQAIDSLTQFISEGRIHDFPQNVAYSKDTYRRPARLWGIGMGLAYLSNEDMKTACDFVGELKQNYGPIPKLRLYPEWYSADSTFYARYSAHALFGMALHEFQKEHVPDVCS